MSPAEKHGIAAAGRPEREDALPENILPPAAAQSSPKPRGALASLGFVAKKLIREAVFTTGSWYHQLAASHPVWWGIVNRRARRFWVEHAEPLTEREEAILRSLGERGIAVVSITDILPPAVFDELRRFAERRWGDPAIQAIAAERARAPLDAKGVKKSFLVPLWEGERTIDLAHPFIRFSLSAPILRVVAVYLGLAPKFRDWRLEATVPTPEGMRPRASQRWHRDQEDQKLVKTFLYLNDVDEASGPFMYVEGAHVGGRWQELFPRVPPRGTLPMPEDVDSRIPWPDVRTCTGPAGTLIFCDTSGLHQGGYAKSKHRLMYTSVYTTAAAPWPIRYRYPEAFQSDELNPLARFAVANDPTQRPPKYFR